MPYGEQSGVSFGAGAGTVYWRDTDGDGIPEPYYVDGSSAANDAAIVTTLGGSWTPELAQANLAADAPMHQQQWTAADELQRQRQAAAAGFLARTSAGQSAAQAQQALGLGGIQQQAMAAGVSRPLAARAAMYGQSRAADQLIAQSARQRSQEQLAAQAMQQQALGAGAQQYMGQAQQLLQRHGIAQQEQAAREKRFAEEAAAEEAEMMQIIGTSTGVAGALASPASDRRLKMRIHNPGSSQEQRLLKALRGAG